MSDGSPGLGWWLASDGRWYAPELHPDLAAPPATPPVAASGIPAGTMPSLGGNPWAAPRIEPVAGPVPGWPDPGAWGTPPSPETVAPRRARPVAIVVGVVAALVALAVAAPFAGHVVGTLSRQGPGVPAADRIVIPSTPPGTLAGLPANPRGLEENAEWSQLASRMAAASSVSFSSVYGVYPPTALPTTATFFVVAAAPTGGIGDIPAEVNREIGGVRSLAAGTPGARFASTPVGPSVYDGQLACVSLTLPKGAVGECLWLNPVDVVELVTFSPDLTSVAALTEQVVNQLHSGSASV